MDTLSYRHSVVTMAASLAISDSETFSDQKWHVTIALLYLVPFWTYLTINISWPEIRVKRHSRSTIWKLGCGFVLTFYSNNGAILYHLRYSDLLVENRDIFITQLYVAPPQGGGDPVGILRRCLISVKLEWLGCCAAKKLWQYVKPFPWNTGTDGQTNGQTDRIAI